MLAALPLEVFADARRIDDDGGLVVVYGAKGGNIFGFCAGDGLAGGVFGG